MILLQKYFLYFIYHDINQQFFFALENSHFKTYVFNFIFHGVNGLFNRLHQNFNLTTSVLYCLSLVILYLQFCDIFLYFVHLLDNAPEFGVCFHIEISILFHFLINAKYLFEYLYIVLTMNPFKSEVCIAILFLCNGYFFLSFSLCVIGCNKLNL